MPRKNNDLQAAQAAQQAMRIAYGGISPYNSVVSLGYRNRGTDCIMPIGYIPTGEVDINELAIRPDPDKDYYKDYYITANTLSRCYRCQDNLYSLRNIVIDIDCHSDDLTYQGRQKLLSDYYAQLQRDYPDLPTCNIVHYTGRGMQLWYCLNEIAGVWAWYYRIVVDKLVAILRQLQAEYSDFADISIDSGASRNTVGYYRLFGSYNTRSQTQGIVTIIRDVRWDLDNLCKAIPTVDADVDSKPSVSATAAVAETEADYHGLQYKRLSYLRWLQQHRNAPVGAEMRDIMLLLHYNAAKQIMPQEQAQAATLAFNRAFRQPLGRTDNIFSYLDQKGHLKFKVNTWCDFLQLTAEERDVYMMQHSHATRDGQRSAKKAAKEQRNQQILRMKKAGMTNLAIADVVNVTPKTVYAVLKKIGYQADDRKARILAYRAKGLQVMEICKLMEISKQTYYNILSK